GPEAPDEHGLEEVGGGPDPVVPQGQGREPPGLELLGDLEELVHGPGRLDPGGLEDLPVVPEHIGPVDVRWDRVVVAVVLQQIEEPPGIRLLPAGLLEQVVEGLHEAGDDPGVDELPAHVDLEGVRRVAAHHPGLQHGLGVLAGAAGDGGVDDLQARLLPLGDLEEPEEPGRLAAGGPPREDLELGRPLCQGAHRHDRQGCADPPRPDRGPDRGPDRAPHRRPPVPHARIRPAVRPLLGPGERRSLDRPARPVASTGSSTLYRAGTWRQPRRRARRTGRVTIPPVPGFRWRTMLVLCGALALHNALRLGPAPLVEELRGRYGADYTDIGN